MRIAIIGASPSQVKAPFNDPSWVIWTCSPGVVGVPRVDLHFEIHMLAEIERSGPNYLEYLRAVPVLMQEHFPQFPMSEPFPKDEMIAEFGTHYMTSSVAWMLALAISKKPDEIGIWGVDMMALDEYQAQRPGCFRFIDMAKDRGIVVTIPDGSGLLKPSRLYGYDY